MTTAPAVEQRQPTEKFHPLDSVLARRYPTYFTELYPDDSSSENSVDQPEAPHFAQPATR